MDAKRHEKRDFEKEFGFEPLESFDPRRIVIVDDLVRAYNKTPFISGDIGKAADIFEEMVRNKDCLKVLTLSGAMTPAKMDGVIIAMIESGMVDVIISTGALMSHGFVSSMGMKHYKIPKNVSDTELRDMGMNRIYTAGEPETNLDEAENIVNNVLSSFNKESISSQELCYLLGKYLYENIKGDGILKSAYSKKVPVFIPAFTDSELGLDFDIFNRRLSKSGKKEIFFDSFADLRKYGEIVLNSKKLGIFTVGGGVPRNWAQQIGPYLDVLKHRGLAEPGKDYEKVFFYGVRICPDAVELGHLSGCTYEEGVSWGKFDPKGKYAEVKCDATVAWPLIVTAVIQRLMKGKL